MRATAIAALCAALAPALAGCYYSVGVVSVGGGPGIRLQAGVSGPREVTLSWSGRSDAFTYAVERDGAEIVRTPSQSALDRSVLPGASHCYRVVALLAFGGAVASNTDCVSVPPVVQSMAQPQAGETSGLDASVGPAEAADLPPLKDAAGQVHRWRLEAGVLRHATDDTPGGAADGTVVAVDLAAPPALATCGPDVCAAFATGSPASPGAVRFARRRPDGAWTVEPVAAGYSVATGALRFEADGTPLLRLADPQGGSVLVRRTAAGWTAIARD